MKKTILVCGDLVWDTHIARLPTAPKGYFQAHLQSQLTNRHGGAWYLHDMIQKAVGALEIDAQVFEPARVSHAEIEENLGDSLGIAKGFSVWEWFEAREQSAKPKTVEKNGVECIEAKWKDGEPCPGAWRIKEFLGCQQAQWPNEGETTRTCPAIQGGSPEPDLLVIDDLGLGFSKHAQCWPGCLSNTSTAVLIKASPPFDTPLWQRLHEREGDPNITVVIAAAALRDAGAHLSRGLSWDRTLEEVKAEFSPGGVGWPLRSCKRVIVSFGRSGAAVFSRVPRSPEEEECKPADLQFERLVLDPEYLEEVWTAGIPGTSFGSTSALVAAVAAYSLAEREPSSHLMASRGLEAARVLHRIGGGHNESALDLAVAENRIFAADTSPAPEEVFLSAFPRELLDNPVLMVPAAMPPAEKQTLLTDVLGLSSAFLTVAAQDIVRRGPKQTLKSLPRLRIGKYLTVDREEIECLNTVRNQIQDYRRNEEDKRPLSLAVFGPPGAGKSFAIKELAKSLFGKDQAVLEFNLSQFEDLAALHEAFHEVRDESVQGKLPLVFWDEFDSMRDTTSLGWLKEFLAPMQDAKFVSRGKSHPFGKCIFVFAGGTSSKFQEFIKPITPQAWKEDEKDAEKKAKDEFRKVKGTDFVSRLRGYVNIKGPNPTAASGDEVHLIRRALLLRSLIERHHKNQIDPVTDKLSVSPTVLDAFLRVGDKTEKGVPSGYLHGARSMEAIVSLSRLHGSRHFGPSELPGREVLELHVTSDFIDKVNDKSRYHLAPDDIDKLAAWKHDKWKAEKMANDYVYGKLRNDIAKPHTHPLILPYEELKPEDKESNRFPARLAHLRLEALGFRICQADHPVGEIVSKLDDSVLNTLAISEHRRWMRQNLLKGYSWTAAHSADELLLHTDICKFSKLEHSEKLLDREVIAGIQEFMKARGLVLVKVAEPSTHNP